MNVINAISGGGGGGLVPMIKVTAPAGSTVKCDGVAGTEVSGTWTFSTTLGTHTILATLGTKSETQSVLVDRVGIYPITITYRRLPIGFTEVEYIQSSGTQCINTGVQGNNSNIKIECDFEFLSNKGLYAVHNPNTNYRGYFNYTDCRAFTNTNQWNYSLSLNTRYSIVYTETEFKIDGTVITPTINEGTSTSSQNIYIFERYKYGSSGQYCDDKLYFFNIYDGNTPVRIFVPCQNDETLKYGLYDIKYGQFYPDANGGNFVGGEPV